MNNKILNNHINEVYNFMKGGSFMVNNREDFQDVNIDNIDDFKKVWKETCSDYTLQPSDLPKVKRIIVIGDIHGDRSMMIESLALAGVIDEKTEKWIGGETVIVQVGDQIDRCRANGVDSCMKKDFTIDDEDSDWNILQFMTKLHNDAQNSGGAVYSLLGNHEIMNVKGDMRYVSYKGLVGFDESESLKDGMKNRKAKFKPGNEISNFLACTRKAVLKIGSNLFVHAGVLPRISKNYTDLDFINRLMTLYLMDRMPDMDKKQFRELFLNKNSILWTREFGNMGLEASNPAFDSKQHEKKCDYLLKGLQVYNVNNIFVGHTPMIEKGISSVCNNRVWLTDYGASKAFDLYNNAVKKVQVLEILNDNVFNIIKAE
jgi:hypothetical protein